MTSPVYHKLPPFEGCTSDNDCLSDSYPCCMRQNDESAAQCMDPTRVPLVHHQDSFSLCKSKYLHDMTPSPLTKPMQITIQEVTVPLLESELRVSDDLTYGTPTGAMRHAFVNLPVTHEGVISTNQSPGQLYMSDVADVGRGVGLYPKTMTSDIQESSKGIFISRVLTRLVDAQTRTVIFTHMPGPCGGEGLQQLLLSMGMVQYTDRRPEVPISYKFGRITKIMPYTEVQKIQLDYNSGLFSTLLVENISEGLSFDNVQTMIITEATANAATWIQETARIARMASYTLEGYYTKSPNEVHSLKHPHVIQLISTADMEDEQKTNWGRMVQYIAIPTLMLAITSAWNLGGKHVIRGIPTYLERIDPRDVARARSGLKWAQHSSGLRYIPGAPLTMEVTSAALEGDASKIQQKLVKDNILKHLFRLNVLQTFATVVLMRNVTYRAVLRWAGTAERLIFPKNVPSRPAYERNPAVTALVTGEYSRPLEEKLSRTFDENARKRCNTYLGPIRQLDKACEELRSELVKEPGGNEDLGSFHVYFKKWKFHAKSEDGKLEVPPEEQKDKFVDEHRARMRAQRLIQKWNREGIPVRLLAYMAPGTGKSILAWDCIFSVMEKPLVATTSFDILYITARNTQTGFLLDGLNATWSLLHTPNLTNPRLHGAALSILSHLRNNLPGTHVPDAHVPQLIQDSPIVINTKFTMLYYDANVRAQLDLFLKRKAGGKILVCDEVHNALDIENRENRASMERLFERARDDNLELYMLMTGTLPSVSSFCSLSSLVRPVLTPAEMAQGAMSIERLDEMGWRESIWSGPLCSERYFTIPTMISAQRKIMEVVLPILKFFLPAVEYIKGNLLITTLTGFFTTTYILIGDAERWEISHGTWETEEIVRNVRDNLLYAPPVVEHPIVVPRIDAGAYLSGYFDERVKSFSPKLLTEHQRQRG